MDANFNLLPLNQKKKLIKVKFINTIIWQEILAILMVLILVLFLLGTSWVESIKIKAQGTMVNKKINQNDFQKIKKYQEKFIAVNKKINLIDKVLQNNYYWSKPLNEIWSLESSYLVIKEIKSKDNHIEISGVASTREKLVNFKNSLEQNNCFSQVKIPITDLMLRENIAFHIDVWIKKNCFKLK